MSKEITGTRVIAHSIVSALESTIPYACSIVTANSVSRQDGIFSQTDVEGMFAIDSARVFSYVAALLSLKADLIGWPGIYVMSGVLLSGMVQAGYMNWRIAQAN